MTKKSPKSAEPSHSPIERERGVIDCTCGYRQQGYYSTDLGARGHYLEHVAVETAARAGWPGDVDIDYREQDD